MAVTITLLILLAISLFALKVTIAFKLIDFAYNRWIRPQYGAAGRGRSIGAMILRERFASGEIDEDELRRKLAVLSGR
jgi:uncharacterized membrane protein